MNFQRQKTKGQIGEAITLDYLHSSGWMVIDTCEHPLFQGLDIDHVAKKDDLVVTIDSKLDANDTGNFFIETVSNDTTGSPGCIYQSAADYWFYHIEPQQMTYIFSPERMRAHIEKHDYPERYAATHYRGSVAYRSVGVLVPIENFRQAKAIDVSGYFLEL